MKTRSLATLTKILNKHAANIAKERDALRELQDEIEEILHPANRAIEALENAVDAISEQL
jgi:F0F1-type ATP synthase membrane subunit b/b'